MRARIFVIATMAVLMITTVGCKKEFLDLDPIDRYTYYNFPTNESQVDQAVSGVYRKLFPIYNSQLWIWGEFLSDNTSFRFNPNDRGGTPIEEIDEFVAVADNGTFNGMYEESLDGIQRTNYVLQNLDQISFSSDSIKQIRKAEALFFRAWHYFNLVRIYGDMPIIRRVIDDPRVGSNPLSEYPRRPVDEVYSQIILPDAQFALDSLPQSIPVTQKGRLTKSAARMLLAKILMTQKRFSEALTILEPITSSGFSLNGTFENNFNPATKNGTESILEVQADPALGYSFSFMNSWTPWGTGANIWPGGSNSRGGLNQPTASLNNAYEPNDNRKSVTIGVFNNILYLKKFLYWDPVQRANTTNFIVYRYADALLMLAECLNEVGFPNEQAFGYLNQVRARAGLLPKTNGNPEPALDVSSQDAFRLAIEQERRVELAGENHRWFDLVRTGRAETIMTEHGIQEKGLKPTVNSSAYNNIQTIMAIPNREVLQFGYPQNPGW